MPSTAFPSSPPVWTARPTPDGSAARSDSTVNIPAYPAHQSPEVILPTELKAQQVMTQEAMDLLTELLGAGPVSATFLDGKDRYSNQHADAVSLETTHLRGRGS